MNKNHLEKYLDKIISVIYPRHCPVCEEIVSPTGRMFCKDCIRKLSFVKTPVCLKCGKEIFDAQKEYCEDCAKRKKSYEYGMALLNYDELTEKIMINIKYHNKREYIKALSKLLVSRYGSEILKLKVDVLLPIPVHKKRLRQRGYNQSELITKEVAKELNLSYSEDVLVRNKNTKAQKELSPEQRLANLSAAFACSEEAKRYRKVLLVDDIYTTGSTIEACTRLLKEKGVREVYYVSLAIGRTLV